MKELELFQKILPKNLKDFFKLINNEGFKVGVIGGVCRDFLKESSLSHDVDIELRPKEDCGSETLLNQFQSLIETISKSFKVYEKGLNVHEVKLGDFSVELGLPRIETFNGEISHKNFEVKYIADTDYTQGFKRRDFTVNSIMFEFDSEWSLVDPLDGVRDLQIGILRACDNQSFVKDPVRFLRAVRFSLKLNFKMELSLITLLKNMELSLSAHYLRMEAQKSKKALSFSLLCSQLRPSFFPFDFLNRHEFLIESYDRRFGENDTKKHVSQALFLSVNERKKLLDFYELSAKAICEINLKEVNLGFIKNSSVEELSKKLWCSQFIKLISRYKEFGPKKLEWLLREEGVEVGVSFFEDYQKIEVKTSELPAKFKSFYTLKERVKKLVS